ncbi:MAG: NAD-dependent succinate-semialdehyde dehydrogenase [Proteobacteria bacterium]|nr:NAD-dependent succinate-semialdehyde dehydrogenase [Pseudomonadota bacterium]
MESLLKSQCFINGSWKDAENKASFAVTNPANRDEILRVADASDKEAREAVDAAAAAFPAWKNTLPKDRAKILREWHRLILKHAEELASILTSEQGKPLAEARGEIASGAAMVEWSAEEARRYYGQTIPPFKSGTRVMTTREPVGVVAAITPWNFPHSMITRKVAPALAAGCTVVLKPAEDTPLSALALAALAEEAGFPKGIFNVVPTSKPASVGNVLTDDDRVRKLSFTGSTEVGRMLMARCAPTLKRVSLELGGNAPFIVFDDADIEAAISGVMASKFRNAGQTCICANRIYVQKGIYARFAEALQKAIVGLKVGNGQETGVTTGPLINKEGLDKVNALLKDATSKGGRVACGGKQSALGGTFYEPTLILDAKPEMRLSKEEIFGPIAALYPFETEAEVIAMANASEYGLAAYFWTKDLGRAFRVTEALEYGMVAVNESLLASEAVPFGGVKHSGFGREGGKQSLDDYTAIKYTLFGGI